MFSKEACAAFANASAIDGVLEIDSKFEARSLRSIQIKIEQQNMLKASCCLSSSEDAKRIMSSR